MVTMVIVRTSIKNKMYLHVNINNIISNSNNDNSKKFLEQNQNQI